MSKTYSTRERYRADIEAALSDAVAEGRITAREAYDPALVLQEGEADVPVVTLAFLQENLRGIFRDELPPPDEHGAEVRTPSMLTVWAKCPNCGIHMVIPLQVTPQQVLADGVGELKLKARSKGRIHACGQLTLDEPDGQLAFAPDAAAGADVEEVSEDAEPTGPEPTPIKTKRGDK